MFQIIKRDGMGRIGKVKTAHGNFTTPTLMPVIDPTDIVLTPREIKREFGAELIITNAYLTLLHFGKNPDLKIHQILDYDGPIMTDSGGYQILRYGSIDVPPEEIVRYQDLISPDIATILDIPTGVNASREYAAETVRITLERAREALRILSNPNVMWCGPIQGGLFTDLVEHSAREMGKLDYKFHAIGSPVELLNDYRYTEVVDLVMAAKKNLPLERPVHLFGAGHPMMLSLAVAMGCDLFDSAAYILFARDDRYMTAEGTLHLNELEFLPCECPVCSSTTVKEIRREPLDEKIKLLARHNLHVTFGELRKIRQAIVDGRLLEYVQIKCRAHPSLLAALKRFMDYSEFIERFDPVTKKSAFFYSGSESIKRPEVIRHQQRMKSRYTPPRQDTLIILSGFGEKTNVDAGDSHVLKIVPPFGVVPEELEEIYPLSQNEVPKELEAEVIAAAAESLENYLKRHGSSYRQVILFNDRSCWGESLVRACQPVAEKLKVIQANEKNLNKLWHEFSAEWIGIFNG
ncbi:MAG: tRNA guanosine(15) transglycosylase TgtA [Candidatus Hadarchaeum sp.]|uniref:tRNA guanosine(15) transglycosylase TgtA n=1 Tax=Candidatus Hadarchaeum sp. TaxID=2883567 RepID=UPI003D0FE2C5